MSQNKEKTFIHKALTAINKGDATALRKNIKEAILSKVRRAVAKREKQIAKSFLDEATNIQEESPSTAEKIALHLKHILKVAPGKDRANVANQIMNLVGKDKSFKNPKFDKAFGKLLPLATTENKVLRTEFEKAVQDTMNAL